MWTAPVRAWPCHGVLRDRDCEASRSTLTVAAGSTSTRLAGRAGGDRVAVVGQAGDPRRAGGHQPGEVGPAEPAVGDEQVVHHREGGLEAEHAERRVDERVLLVVPGVRGVVGGDRVDGAVEQALDERLAVLAGAQRRVDLEDRVVAGEQLGAQREVVRGHLRGDPDAARLRPAHDVEPLGGADVRDVHPLTGVLGEQGVAGDDARLGDRGPPRQSEPPGELALVAARLRAGEGRVLAVLGDDTVEGPHVLQGPAHDPAVGDAVAVVGEDLHAGAGAVHQAQLGELRRRRAPW